MQNAFHIDVGQSGDATVLSPHGDLDLATAGQLKQALETAMEDGPGIVVVDLSAVGFMDSTGLRVVLAANERASEATRDFALVQGPPQVQRLLEVTQAHEHVRIAPDLHELLS
jgi:stage II sporulation protein AA (anti-sigma F factor antagonist)